LALAGWAKSQNREGLAVTPQELDEIKSWHQDKERYPPELGWADTCQKCGPPWPCDAKRLIDEVERLGRGIDALLSEKNVLETLFIERGVAPSVENERLRAWLDFAEELIDIHFFGNRVGDKEAADAMAFARETDEWPPKWERTDSAALRIVEGDWPRGLPPDKADLIRQKLAGDGQATEEAGDDPIRTTAADHASNVEGELAAEIGPIAPEVQRPIDELDWDKERKGHGLPPIAHHRMTVEDIEAFSKELRDEDVEEPPRDPRRRREPEDHGHRA
jgi:hypothetical protein